MIVYGSLRVERYGSFMFRDSRIFCVSLFTLSSKSQIQKIWPCPMGRTCPPVTPFASNELYIVLPSVATRPLGTFFCVVPLRSRQSRNSRATFIKSPCGRIVIGTIYHLPKKAKKNPVLPSLRQFLRPVFKSGWRDRSSVQDLSRPVPGVQLSRSHLFFPLVHCVPLISIVGNKGRMYR